MLKLLLGALMALSGSAVAQPQSYSFGVIPQRSALLTAQYWNPILDYVGRKSGVVLELKLSRTGPEHAAAIGRGEFDFLYSNHNFTKRNARVGYQVLARPRDEAIRGEIVVLASTPAKSLAALAGKEVAFPSKAAFVGFYVPMDALLRAGIKVQPVFAANQEGAMAQLKAGRVVAAAVNSQVMRGFAARENVEYRVLWTSEAFLNIPIAAHPSVPKSTVRAVQRALVEMADDPQGAAILAVSAELVKQKPPLGFVRAGDADYVSHLRFHRSSVVKEEP
jgi:phosphonate transport system substrate-binding protein